MDDAEAAALPSSTVVCLALISFLTKAPMPTSWLDDELLKAEPPPGAAQGSRPRAHPALGHQLVSKTGGAAGLVPSAPYARRHQGARLSD